MNWFLKIILDFLKKLFGSHSSFDNFEMDPIKNKGWETWGWMWISDSDLAKLADEMVKSGINTYNLSLFACTMKSDGKEIGPDGNTCYGYWTLHFNDSVFQSKLKKLMDTMRKHKITVSVTVASGNFRNGEKDPATGKPIDTCSELLNDNWFMDIINWFKKYADDNKMADASGNIIGIKMVPVNELGHSSSSACLSKLMHWSDLFISTWMGGRGWNGDGGAPKSLPSGYQYAEYHPQKQVDLGPNGFPVVILNDAPIDINLTNEDGSLNLDVAIPYFKRVKDNGRGFSALYPKFLGTVDFKGIEALKDV